MPLPPTHRITHTDGSEVDIYIASTLQRQLESSMLSSMQSARDSVCINFRHAGIAKFGERWGRSHKYVEWKQLTVTAQDFSSSYDDDDEGEDVCDECPSCDTGYHERCSRRGGCPNARLR